MRLNMYRQSFGSTGQVQFANEHEYYRLLGYLAKSDGSTELAWEHNEEQGAWGSEGRIKFRSPKPNNIGTLKLTAGVGNVLYRVNCNSFVEICTQTTTMYKALDKIYHRY